MSPRSFFLFTALLPQVTTGSLEERSITESIRKILRKKVSGSWTGGEAHRHLVLWATAMQGEEKLGGWAGSSSHKGVWPLWVYILCE